MKTRKCILKIMTLVFALTFIPGCGSKDNEVTDGTGSSNTTSTTTYGVFNEEGVSYCRQDINDLTSLRVAIAQGDFIRQYWQNESYEIQQGSYNYTVSTNEWKWFTMNSYRNRWVESDIFDRESRIGGSIIHEYGSTKEEVRNYMMSNILDPATNYRRMGSTYHEVLLPDGDVVGFDLCLPIIANPVYRYDSTTREITRFLRYQAF